MSDIVYRCTRASKEVEIDDYEEGLTNKGRSCVMDQECGITAESLPELIRKVGSYYGLDIDDVFIPGDEDEDIAYVGYNRLENADGDEPDDDEKEDWKKGECTLYLADYSFHIEKCQTLPITKKDFEEAKITTH